MNLLLAHGSSDGRHGEQLRKLCEQVALLLGEDVQAAFLSDASLRKGGAKVLPLFLGDGDHMRRDVPALVEASGATLLPPLGVDLLAGMAFDLATREGSNANLLFGVYRFTDFEPLNEALLRCKGRCARMVLAAIHSQPSLPELLSAWRAQGISTVQVQPVLLFEGKTLSHLQSQADMIADMDVKMGDVLSRHKDFAAAVAAAFRRRL